MVYYYMKNGRAMTPSGSFTSDVRRWMRFTIEEVERITLAGARPYGATMAGTFEGFPDSRY